MAISAGHRSIFAALHGDVSIWVNIFLVPTMLCVFLYDWGFFCIIRQFVLLIVDEIYIKINMSCLRLPKKSQDFSILSTNSIKAVFVVRNISHEYFSYNGFYTMPIYARSNLHIHLDAGGYRQRRQVWGLLTRVNSIQHTYNNCLRLTITKYCEISKLKTHGS